MTPGPTSSRHGVLSIREGEALQVRNTIQPRQPARGLIRGARVRGLLVRGGLWAVLVLAAGVAAMPVARGQESRPGSGQEPGQRSEAPVSGGPPIDSARIESLQQPDPPPRPVASEPSGIDLLTLIGSGGKFMLPIGLMSLLVVTLAVERLVSLRRQRVIPHDLVKRLSAHASPLDRFDPAAAYATCQRSRSVAGTVVSAMLLRTGQPLADIERAATETVQREADRYAGPIRWLNLAAAATPLMGLLGTVWGMIVAFHESTTLTPDRSRSEQLSEGIYTALVTTLAGLVVAIPAAIIAQYLENRLGKLFHRVEELAFRLAPALERFRGKMRLDPDEGLCPLAGDGGEPPAGGRATSSSPRAIPSAASESPAEAAGEAAAADPISRS